MVTSAIQGGQCGEYSLEGIMYREQDIPITATWDHVASRCRYPKLIKYYTDIHDVDEDVIITMEQSGHWGWGTAPGIVCRYMANTPFYADNTVASLKKK